MNEKEIKLKCLELTNSTFGLIGIETQLVAAKKLYDFVNQKSDAIIDAATNELNEHQHVIRTQDGQKVKDRSGSSYIC